MADLKRIVVGLDGSTLAEAALPYAEVFARAHQAALVLVRAVSPVHDPADIPERRTHTPADDEVGDPPEMDFPRTRHLVYEAEHYLATIARQLRERGALVDVVVVIGEPARILVEEARGHDAEMIILSTHGRAGFGRWIYGSVADQVMREARMPVLLVPPACRLPWPRDHTPRILIPLDGSPRAEEVLGPACALAVPLCAQVVLTRIVEPIAVAEPSMGRVSLGNALDREIRAVSDVERGHAYVATVAAKLHADGLRVQIAEGIGPASMTIAEIARDEGADLVALTPHGCQGDNGPALGDTAFGIIRLADMPILVVHHPTPGG
ncbi:MAG TPA: universal stress protein [Chloroflexota bacterium]|nr:universal stress protein [Chloroflexota bacterium]